MGIFSIVRNISYPKNSLSAMLVKMASFPDWVKLMIRRMNAVFLMGNIFKIFNRVVVLVSVLMVSFKTFRFFTKKRLSNKAMNFSGIANSINPKNNLTIPSFIFTRRKNSTANSSAVSYSFYSSYIGNLINTFKTNNISPYFHNLSSFLLIKVIFIVTIMTLGITLSSVSFAQEATQDTFYVLEDFSKGMQSHTSSFNNPEGVAGDVLNVRFNGQIGSITKREPLIAYGTCNATAPVKSLHRYYKSNLEKYLIENIDTAIYSGSDTGGACTTIATGKTAGKRWDWVTFKDTAIGTNGTDYPVKWDGKTQVTADTDGSRTAGDLVADLGSPFAELNTGTGLDASSWYQYKIAYDDGTNYYFSNSKSNPILTGSAVKGITLTGIPPCNLAWASCNRHIYRTVGDASRDLVVEDASYYKVTTIASSATISFDDTLSDAALLGDATPKWSTASAGINVTPPNGKHLLIDNERLWIANNPLIGQGGSTAYFSYVLDADKFNTTNDLFLVRPDDGDEITMLETYLGVIVVGKNGSISKIYTNSTDTDDWTVSIPLSYVGCSSPYSVKTTPLGIVYLSPFGIYKYDGSSSGLLSDAVTADIRLISSSSIAEASAIYFNNEYDLAYTDSSTGENINNRVLLYDFVRQAWSKDIKYIDSWAIFDSGTDFSTLYSGSSKSDGKVSANSSAENQFITRYKSELDAGTFDNTESSGEESNPILALGSNLTIDATIYSSTTINGFSPSTAIIDRFTTTGTWESSALDLNASEFNKLSWNASLGTYGSVAFYIKTATTSAGLAGASYSSALTNPSGSDISGVTAGKWVQIKAVLTTTDITESPELDIVDSYMVKITYSKVGAIDETSVYALWQSGWTELGGTAQNPKVVKEIIVYYTGDSGTINVKANNLKGDISANFNIDLAHPRDPANGYFGDGTEKVFRYNLPLASGVANFLVGDKFKFTISEDSTSTWKIQRIAVRFSTTPYVTYR